MNNKSLKELLIHARQRPIKDWHGYACVNTRLDVKRLTFFHEGFQVQVSEITHQKTPHCHSSDLTFLILDGGYQWFLQQMGAKFSLEMYAAVGSVIRLAANDTHWIPIQKYKSLEFSVSKATDIEPSDAQTLDYTEMNRLWNLFNNKFDQLLMKTPNFLVDVWDGSEEMPLFTGDQTPPPSKKHTLIKTA